MPFRISRGHVQSGRIESPPELAHEPEPGTDLGEQRSRPKHVFRVRCSPILRIEESPSPLFAR
jgi:hypothetical protein